MTRQTTTPLPQLIYPRVIHLQRRLKDLIYTPLCNAQIEVQIGPVHHHTFIKWDEAIHEPYEPIRIGDSFGPASVTKENGIKEFPWTQRWFRVDIELPSNFTHEHGHEYCLYFLAHGEFTAYTKSGDVWCGIDPMHDRIPLSMLIENGMISTTTVWLDAGQWQTGFWFGLEPPTEELGFRLLKVELQRKNPVAYDVYHDLSMLIEWVEFMYSKEGIPLNTENGYYQPLTSVAPSLRRALHMLNQVCDEYDREIQSRNLTPLFQDIELVKLKDRLKSIFDIVTTSPTSTNQMKICRVGHAHMDLVWLWPERVTYQKIVHSYANVLQLMKKYKDFVFTMSQPPLFYHIQKNHPKMADDIQKLIRDGRWEFTGACEVETDTQIPVGEGLVRCILYGQERIKAIRGTASETVWIPDVFGYSQCLPQIFFLAEVQNFFTTKILWSTITKFPHSSFVWVGPDGESSVLTHLGVTGYSSKITMQESNQAVRDYQQADVHDEVLCPSGYGDGGGGPHEDQITRSLKMKRAFIGEAPSCHWGSADSFFERLSSVKEDLPIYRGELFLEYHRAVHTTQSDFKSNLRNCERALQTREALRVISGNYEPLGMAENWERYFFMMFHDATPGSSIHTVYQELNAELKLLAERQYASAAEEWPNQSTTDDDDDTFTIVNQLAWKRCCLVELPADMFREGTHSSHYVHSKEDETFVPIQIIDGKPCAWVELEGLSAMPYSYVPKSAKRARYENRDMRATPTSMSNGIVDAVFDQYGQFSSMSVHGKPLLLTKDEAATFTLHEDNPEAFDAWDMDHHCVWLHQSAIKDPVTLTVLACGPIASILRSNPIPIGSNGSAMQIEYRLYSGQDSLHVSCIVDWKEKHKTLRYQVPTDYRGDLARFGAPFNFVDRSQIPQTQKEEAQWEVPASRWASALNGSMSDGLSIVTEAKYGFRAKMGILSFTLLRSSTYPDSQADQGHHTIRYAISRHQNTFSGIDTNCMVKKALIPTAAKADEIFTPHIVLARAGTTFGPIPKALLTFIDLGSAVPSWVMPCQNKNDSAFCVRLHEVSGANTNVTGTLSNNGTVKMVNFNEKTLKQVEKTKSTTHEGEHNFSFEVRAYQIVTLRVEYRSL